MQTLTLATLLHCQACGKPLVVTESGWLACYWLCDRLKSREYLIERVLRAGLAATWAAAAKLVDQSVNEQGVSK